MSEFRISNYFNRDVMDRWARVYVHLNTRTGSGRAYFALNYQIWHLSRMMRGYLFQALLFGDLRSISLFFTKNTLPLDFLF